MSEITPVQADALAPKVTKPAIKPVAAKKPAAKKLVVAKPIAKASVKPVAKAKPALKVKAKTAPKAKAVPKAKAQKVKMERDSFTMPKAEYAQLALLKARLAALGQPTKKSELLRAGIKQLVAMSDNTLKMTLAKIPVIKTGRPKKK